MGNIAGVSRAYGNMGSAYHSLGNFKQSIEYHNQALTFVKLLGNRAEEGSCYGNLGNAYHRLGNFKQAIEYYNQHLTIAKEVESRAGEGRAYANLGNALQSLGNFKQAIEYHNQALTIAKEVGDRATEGNCYGNLGIDYQRLGDSKQAIEYHNQELTTAKEVGDSAEEGRAYHSLGRAFESSGSISEALNYYRSSVKIFEQTRALLQLEDAWKIDFRDLYQVVYTARWKTLLKNGETEEALYAAEQGRAQALMDILKNQYAFVVDPSTSVEPNETISYMLKDLSTQTVLIALDKGFIKFWLLSKSKKIQFESMKLEQGSATLMETVLKEIGADVGVQCENRSLEQLSNDPPSSNRGKIQSPTTT